MSAPLRILSMNLWFDPLRMDERMRAFVDVIRAHAPDLVLCQEVTPHMLQTLRSLLQHDQFNVLCGLEPADRKYGEVMLVRQAGPWVIAPATQPFHMPFENSSMGRGLHVVELKHTETAHRVLVGTTHLESLAQNGAVRRAQLLSSLRLMHGSGKPFVLGGDLNLTAADDRTLHLPPFVRDAWQSAGSPEQHRYTWDTSINTNLDATYRARCRFDRLLHHAESVMVSSFRTVAQEPLPRISPPLFCSDHWGILANFDSPSIMSRKRGLTDLETFRRHIDECEDVFLLRDLKALSEKEKLPVNARTIKEQCRILQGHLVATVSEPLPDVKIDAKPAAVPAAGALGALLKQVSGAPGTAQKKQREARAQLYQIRRDFRSWVREQVRNNIKTFLIDYAASATMLSDQGRSNSVLFEATIQPRRKDVPVPPISGWQAVQTHGWNQLVFKVYRQYYMLDNGGTVERQIYQHALDTLLNLRHCPHLLHMAAHGSALWLDVFQDRDMRAYAVSKLGLDSRDTETHLDIIVMDKSLGATSLADMIEKDKNIDSSPTKVRMYVGIIFQILYTLQCFSLWGLKHNDLHFGNILVEKLKSPIRLSYDLGREDKRIVQITTSHLVRIIDFDQACMYHPFVERNLRLDLQSFASNARDDRYDGLGVLFQMLHAFKSRSIEIVTWLRIFLDEATEAAVVQLFETSKKTHTGSLQAVENVKLKQRKRRGKAVVVTEVAVDPEVQRAKEWFNFRRVHIDLKNIGTDEVFSWFAAHNKHVPTVADLLHSVVTYPFRAGDGTFAWVDLASAIDGENEDDVTSAVLSALAATDTLSRVPHERPRRVVEPTMNAQQMKALSWPEVSKFSPGSVDAKQIEPLVPVAMGTLDTLLKELNVLGGQSLRQIWEAEMNLLSLDWQAKACEVFQRFCAQYRRKMVSHDLMLACLLVTCPMFYGLPDDVRAYLIQQDPDDPANLTEKFYGEIWKSFRHRLPIALPQLNGMH